MYYVKKLKFFTEPFISFFFWENIFSKDFSNPLKKSDNGQRAQAITNVSISNDQSLATSLNSISSKPKELTKSHSASLSDHVPATPLDSTSSSPRSIDRTAATAADKFVHTVCGGFSKEAFHKRNDLQLKEASSTASREKSDYQAIIYINKVKDTEQYSTSLPSSIGNNQTKLIENHLTKKPNEAVFSHNNNYYQRDVNLNSQLEFGPQVRPLMSTEPLMPITVNLGNTDISGTGILNDYPSIINTNPKYDQMQQQKGSSSKLSEQIQKQELEFEKNYVFRMKKVKC